MGNEIYFQKKKESSSHEFMHALTGTFIERKSPIEHETESGDKVMVYPIKIVLGPSKTRVLYLTNQQKTDKWFNELRIASGNTDLEQFYSLEGTLGKG